VESVSLDYVKLRYLLPWNTVISSIIIQLKLLTPHSFQKQQHYNIMHLTTLILSLASVAWAAPQGMPSAAQGPNSGVDKAVFPSPKTAKGAKMIMTALAVVQASVDDLDVSVAKVKGADGANALGDVATKGTGLGDMIKAQQAKIESAPETDLGGALEIQNSAKDLTKSLDKLSDDLIAIEPVVRQAGLSSAVVDILKQQQGNSGGLVKSVTEKLPKAAQGLAKGQTAGVTDSLKKVIAAYEKGMAAAPAPPAPAPLPPAPSASASPLPPAPAPPAMLRV
jgi:hypothetical protein